MSADGQVRRLLLLHDDPGYAEHVRTLLGGSRRACFRVAHYTHLKDALAYLEVADVDLVAVGPRPADAEQCAAVARLGALAPETPVVAVLAGRSGKERERALKSGALECLDAGDLSPELWVRTFLWCLREVEVSRELARVTARLDWLTHMDALTDLLNRRGLERAMMDELARCRAEERDLVVVLADLDEFSHLNANLGHGVGDLVLVGAARRILDAAGPGALVGRCGTDRFIIMLPEADLAEGEAVAERIRLAVSRDVIRAGDQVLTTTASLGVTAIEPESLSFDDVLAKVHFVLQLGRRPGGNGVARAAVVGDVGRMLPPEADADTLRALLRGENIRVAAQPIVNRADGRIVSREMLVRGPAGPLERPDDLFRFCQEKDILVPVDLRCLTRCAEAARSSGDARYHVNIMPATLLQTPAAELERVLRVHPDYGHCCLEISEQQLLGDPTVLVPRVRELQAAGIRIAIDDVGFGNSCLEGLIVLQPQIMKIDKRMVRGLAQDAELRRALNRLLMVADVLGAEVVAEGIESGDDYDVLLDLGVRFGQGYLFGQPKPVVAAAARVVDAGGDGASPADAAGG
ncbi:MAG TPA: bifunctional diguanylate cyclase/phosphodiesterase [Candidatus Krumholzibacteria bacterium]|nr:bifunctional diguanylate cyclase/phosphodiesterase [Candidatus Krumholzibacteria bacterium]